MAEEELLGEESAGEAEGHAAEGEHDEEPKRKKRKPTNIRVAALNITSFLDMSFCLLTFLILSASLTAPEGVLSAKLPKGEGGNVQLETTPPEKELRILLSSNSVDSARIMVEGLPEATPDFKSLTAQLERLQFSERNPNGVYKADNPIIIKPDDTCHWQHIVNAFNAAVAAKFSNVSFASPSHTNE
jgi:biopolymer transport protein ExbD